MAGLERAFSPCFFWILFSQGDALGWVTPLALVAKWISGWVAWLFVVLVAAFAGGAYGLGFPIELEITRWIAIDAFADG